MYYSITGSYLTYASPSQVQNPWTNISVSDIRSQLGQTGSINWGGTKLGVLLKGGAAVTDNTITNVSLNQGLPGKGTDWIYPVAGNSYTVLAPNDLLSYSNRGRVNYFLGSGILTILYSSTQQGYSGLKYIGWNSDPNNLLDGDADWTTDVQSDIPDGQQWNRRLKQYYIATSKQSKLPLKIYQIPSGCSSVTIQAWGGGGGAGGSWSDSYGGYGGAGGYAQTTLVVGSTINPATGRTVKVGDLLYCWVGLGGAGSYDLWYGGVGGMGTAVWLLHGPTFGAIGYPAETGKGVKVDGDYWGILREWVGKSYADNNFVTYEPNLGFEDCLGGNVGQSFTSLGTQLTSNPKNLCVLIAGGGGGGSAINWSGGLQAPSGGSGGSDGASGFFSGSGTGATTTAHGQGLITPNTSSGTSGGYNGCEGAGVWGYNAMYWGTGWSETVRNGAVDTPEASLAALYPNVAEAMNGSQTFGIYAQGGGGGGGAFKGQVGPAVLHDAQSNTRSRGGGGGANKVYLGTNQATVAQGVTNTPYSSDGTHGVGGNPRYVQSPTNYWRGGPGRAGKIILTFNA
jgi:hypothetical protein